LASDIPHSAPGSVKAESINATQIVHPFWKPDKKEPRKSKSRRRFRLRKTVSACLIRASLEVTILLRTASSGESFVLVHDFVQLAK
jgi:hypothetical protein